MMVHPQNSIETPSKVLLNTSGPKFRGRREKEREGRLQQYKMPPCHVSREKGSIKIKE